MDHRDHSAHQADANRGARDPGQPEPAAGLIVADRDRSLLVSEALLPEGTTVPFSFRIEGSRGPLEEFDVLHDRRMHLIVVRRDLARFEHVHPTFSEGIWSVELRPMEPACGGPSPTSRPGEPPSTLGVDLHVSGDYRPERLPEPSDGSRADGFDVRLSSSDERVLRFEVTRGGSAVDLDRFLGARGHLVVLREGDLAFLHVHPIAESLNFAVIYPSPGWYRSFLQFSVEGEVHLAAFTQVVPRAARD